MMTVKWTATMIENTAWMKKAYSYDCKEQKKRDEKVLDCHALDVGVLFEVDIEHRVGEHRGLGLIRIGIVGSSHLSQVLLEGSDHLVGLIVVPDEVFLSSNG